MLNDYESAKKDSRVTCTGLPFTNEKALNKAIQWLKHITRSNGYVLFTDINWIDKVVYVFYVPK